MQTYAAALVMAVALAASSAASAEAPAVEDFRSFCLENRADPVAAFAAAEKSGWKPTPPEAAQSNLEIGGNPEGREINPGSPDYRNLSIGHPKNDPAFETCAITSRTPFDIVTTSVTQRFGPPHKKSSNVWMWQLMQVSGSVRAISRKSDLDTDNVERVFQIFVYDLGEGSIIELDELSGK